MKNKIYIITNENFYFNGENYYCDNIDLKSIPEELNKFSDLHIIGRKSPTQKSKKVNLKNIIISKNIFMYLFEVIKSFKNKNTKYLIISISPFTFIASLIFKIFFKKHFIYLRSDGFEEYKSILGSLGPLLYGFMFYLGTINSNLISCRKHILKNKKGIIVHPSQINEKWLTNRKEINFDQIKLLYIGRIRVEKGIFSLIEILKNSNLELSIITAEKKTQLENIHKNVSVESFENYEDSIIKFYDKNNIFILPSFTEGHPQVLDEALARHRPVIIFEEISHVLRDRKGVFVSKRNINSLNETVSHIKYNFAKINKEIKLNKLPTKKNFMFELKKIMFE